MSFSFNYRKLRGRIVEMCGSQAEFAKEIGLSERSVSLKMQGKVYWRQQEIAKAIEVLELGPEDVQEYFFNVEVQSV